MIEFLGFAHGILVKASKWPDDKITHQAAGQPNHCLWTLGHLASTYEWASGLIDGNASALPSTYGALFGMGSTPTPDAKGYPPIAEVRSQFDSAFNRLMAGAKAATDAQLAESLKEATGGFAENKMDMIYKMAWHDGWHLGQLTTLRKHLGLPSVLT